MPKNRLFASYTNTKGIWTCSNASFGSIISCLNELSGGHHNDCHLFVTCSSYTEFGDQRSTADQYDRFDVLVYSSENFIHVVDTTMIP